VGKRAGNWRQDLSHDASRTVGGCTKSRQAGRKGAWEILVDQFKSLIFGLLLGVAVLSFFLGEIVQGVAILITVVIGFLTELKAIRSIESSVEGRKRNCSITNRGRQHAKTTEARRKS